MVLSVGLIVIILLWSSNADAVKALLSEIASVVVDTKKPPLKATSLPSVSVLVT